MRERVFRRLGARDSAEQCNLNLTGSSKTGRSNWFRGHIGLLKGYELEMAGSVLEPTINAQAGWYLLEPYNRQWGPLKLKLKRNQ